MTRKKALEVIAKKKYETLKDNEVAMTTLFIYGKVGLIEMDNSQLEEYYEKLFDKSITIN